MSEDIFKKLQLELLGLEENILMKDHTTYKIGGIADYFFVAKKKQQVIDALTLAKKFKLPFLILGSGSNLLVSDDGFRGFVIKIDIDGKISLKKNSTILEAGAGILMKELVDFSVSNSLAGLEWAGGLPGTFGGAIRGNAGAFGGETKDSIFNVETIDNNLNLRVLSNKECHFAYRSSIFKTQNWIVLSASLQLKSSDKENLTELAQSHTDYRKERHPLEYPNSGSIFKNTPLSEFSEKMQKELSHVVKKDPFDVVPSAYLISEAGLKGFTVGEGQISKKHPNFIINLGNASAKDILSLMYLVQEKVKEKFGVALEPEVQLVGFDKKVIE